MAKKIDSTFMIDKGRLNSNSPKISTLATESMHDLWIKVQCMTTGTTSIVNDFSRPILAGPAVAASRAEIIAPITGTSGTYSPNTTLYIYIARQKGGLHETLCINNSSKCFKSGDIWSSTNRFYRQTILYKSTRFIVAVGAYPRWKWSTYRASSVNPQLNTVKEVA